MLLSVSMAAPKPDSAAVGGDGGVGAGGDDGGARRNRKRRSADRDGATSTDDENSPGKPGQYECRFCNMRFSKSQALGGHMNRHRQEREREQLQQARDLVSSIAAQQVPRSWASYAMAASPHNPPSLSPSSLSGRSSQIGSQVTYGAGAASPHFPPQMIYPLHVNFNALPRGTAPTSGSNPSVPSSPPNYYLPSNSSSSNLQNMQWGGIDVYNPNAAPPAPMTPRSAPFVVDHTTASTVSVQPPPPLVPPQQEHHRHHNPQQHHDFAASDHMPALINAQRAAIANNPSNNNNNNSFVSSGTPTSTGSLVHQLPSDSYYNHSPPNTRDYPDQYYD